jgi:hypothetical protein
MGAAPLPANPLATKIDGLIKNLEATLGAEIEAYLVAQVPALGLPVIKQLADAIEKLIEDKITVYIETGATEIVIDGQTNSEKESLENAQNDVEKAVISGDPQALASAEKEYQDAQNALVADDGVSPPQ